MSVKRVENLVKTVQYYYDTTVIGGVIGGFITFAATVFGVFKKYKRVEKEMERHRALFDKILSGNGCFGLTYGSNPIGISAENESAMVTLPSAPTLSPGKSDKPLHSSIEKLGDRLFL